MADPVKFVVVGFGKIGKRHADIIIQHQGAELVAVVDVNTEHARVVEEKYKVPFFEGVEQFIEAGVAADVVNICTPNGLHADHALIALKQGYHVVCEKPMGLQKDKCEEVISAALQNARHVFCVMQNRYSPPSVWLKEMMEEQRLGDIHMVQVNCFWNRDKRYYEDSKWKGTLELDGGPLFTQFSHFVDMMYWLFGDIKDIQARFENFNHRHNTEFEDAGYVNFKFTKGGIGTFNYTTSVYNKNLESSITIIGEKGTVKVGGQYMSEVEVCDVEGYEMPQLLPTNPPNEYKGYTGSAANHGHVIQNVIDTLNGDGEISTNALEGLKVVEIIERIYKQRKREAMTEQRVSTSSKQSMR